MSEEVIEEKSKADMIIETISKSTGAVVVFCYLVTIFAVLLGLGYIDQSLFKELILSGALVSAVLRLLKNEK